MEAQSTLAPAGLHPVDTKGLCLLSLDGGGVRGLSSLYILKRIMDRLNDARRRRGLPPVKPCEVFDLIGGTSTGGLIAIMLGRLEMDVDRCIDAYSELAAAVFGEKLRSIPINLRGGIRPRFNLGKLESAIQKVVEDSGASKEDLFDDGIERGCRTFVCTADRYTKAIVRFRSYSLSHESNIRATICQAALATSAATTFFEPVSIGDRSFADGALGANNPVEEVEGEASNIWCHETAELKPLVKCFISIGTGHPGINPFEDQMFEFLGRTLVQIATETENTEKRMIARWASHFDKKRYFRFNVDQGLQGIGLNECEKKGAIDSATEEFLRHLTQKFRVRDCIQNMGLKENKTGLEFATVIEEYTSRQQADLKIGNDPSPLPYASRAAWNSLDREFCLPGTRVEVQNRIRVWLDSDDQKHIFWLAGWPGTGKSTIASTIARDVDGFDDQHWMASFFFSRGDQETSHGERFFSTIAYQLRSKQSKFQTVLEKVISEHKQNSQRISLTDQWENLIATPISRLARSSLPTRLVIVVDALDECENDKDIGQILQLLANPGSAFRHIQLRVLITSRPESRIRNLARCLFEPDLVLQRVDGATVDRDITLFLQHNLSREIVTDGDIKALVRRSARIFVWAASACQQIKSVNGNYATRRLRVILENTDVSSLPVKHLGEIYRAVLEKSLPPECLETEKELLQRLLRTIAVLLSPLSERGLGGLLEIPKGDVHEALDHCHSVLDIPPGQDTPLKIHHPSFRYFLLDDKRCLDPNFWVCEKEAHRAVFECCVNVMCKNLKQDIGKKEAPGTTVSEVSVDEFLLPEVQYACRYWIKHLRRAVFERGDLERLRIVLDKHFLHWIEALSWMGKISEAISSILALGVILRENSHDEDMALALLKRVDDASRFIRYHRVAIETSPLQLYSSSLIFSPSSSLTRLCYKRDRPNYVLNEQMIESDWSLCLHTLEGHGSPVSSIAWSPGSRVTRVASASNDGTVRIWDPVTGECILIIKGHDDSVTSVSWSQDGRQLASASNNGTVKIWDPVTGQCILTLKGDSDRVTSITWSPDSGRLLLVLSHNTIRIWDLATQQKLSTVDKNRNSVRCIAWSQDGSRFASSSYDNTTKVWDPMTGRCILTLEGHGDAVTAIAWSPDGRQLASLSDHKTIMVWDLATRECISTLGEQHASVTSIVWSQDASRLASASEDQIIRVWNPKTRECISELKGHRGRVTSITWSKNGRQLASSSVDNTVRVWDLTARQCISTIAEGHDGSVTSIAWWRDGSRLASASMDGTVKIWDRTTGKCISAPPGSRGTLERHSGSVRSIVWSQDGSRLASTSADRRIGIWDTRTGQCILQLQGHRHRVTSIAWSKDGNRLESASNGGTVKIWDLTTGKCTNKLGEDNFDLLHTTVSSSNLEPSDFVATSLNPSIPLPEAENGQSDKGSSWITDGGQNFLWLPPEYRPSCSWVMFETTIAIGCASGRVLLLEIPKNPHSALRS
ncbi:hypothetical protein N7457_009397 [Penicillium paradoxum]|uniref:uncharacterized protein n=1 Tax=Penicillium paradoxum TaxID=176176 RepID=UPI0025479E32|nr:uncharacterized protein N7457_009397 [Penicillium paradoxum]KAJ5774501.1 hypothetical protein N7457_009397 [Penicillium paradoxum]